jgi:hypothetical protein
VLRAFSSPSTYKFTRFAREKWDRFFVFRPAALILHLLRGQNVTSFASEATFLQNGA